MIPIAIPEANCIFTPPVGIDEKQVSSVAGYVGVAQGGSMDGSKIIVIGWQPTPEEIQRIVNGHCIYLTLCGAVPPHYLSTDFQTATHPK